MELVRRFCLLEGFFGGRGGALKLFFSWSKQQRLSPGRLVAHPLNFWFARNASSFLHTERAGFPFQFSVF